MWANFGLAAILAATFAVVAPDTAFAADEIHEGKVVSVSAGKITVLDNRDNDNDTFIVNAETKITRNGKPAKLSEIQSGDRAKIIAAAQGEKLIAKEIIAVDPE